ncbi:metallophosphoesterase family protein [Photobacterium galatheae]|uniref:Calcineurin-like phosphoesterase domain-containing protein n=1 Tax=Photobacterium galatheae TaxID=1654360 RepID=A0A066RVI0_9GAMM|nr:metallophosphoesterase [Photobacterium galatheae]KDM93106.1 hypothetical protein EA58_02640 [Photobacterium galatheae]MCM0148366.1 metallophosphoesterase [Photobacterium galatheae]
MDTVKIIHISDLHISESLFKEPTSNFKLPHRYGHNIQAFLSLDAYLKENEWDLLVITGDVSRIGNSESFVHVRNWLEGEHINGAHKIGLKLADSVHKQYVLIPGNHDRFNGKLVQTSLDFFHGQFQPVQSGHNKVFYFNGNRVNVHLYDSTQNNKSFAYGYVEPSDMIVKDLDSSLNIAILHHHFIQPPHHSREAASELTNSPDVSAYMLNSEFDGVFFGHTHKGYIDRLNIDMLKEILPDKRTRNRYISKILPKFILRKLDKSCFVSYKRDKARNGQLPTLEKYFLFLFLKKNGVDVKAPNEFKSISDFYRHIDSVDDNRYDRVFKKLREKNILISLAPSACQDEAKHKGFHEIIFKRDNNGCYQPTWKELKFNGHKFI